jgi:tyrosyl-DNA phosphodiesterase-1
VIPTTVPWTIVTNKGHGLVGGQRARPPIKVIQPPHYGTVYGTMHAKTVILFYADRLRIIISTANLIPFDYESIQNMCYVQDFHKNETSHEGACPAMKDLVRFFTAMGIYSDLIDALKEYDLTSFKHQLVISIPGNYRSEEPFSVGFVDLKSKLSLGTCEESDWVEYQCSSIGQLRSHFLLGFMDAVGIPGSSHSSVAKKLRIVFPSRSTAMNGESGFTSIFLSRRSFLSDAFPRSSLYHAVHAMFPEVGMHTKVLSSWKDSRPQWLFIGSHNLSAAAWGCWTLDKTKFIVRNYELGILFRHCSGFVFPYLSPPAKYSRDDLPWMQDLYEE